MRGKLSDVVSLEGAAEFREAAPHARFADVSGAGHMVAGDRNDLFTDAVIGFLRSEVATLSASCRPQALERAGRTEVLDHGSGVGALRVEEARHRGGQPRLGQEVQAVGRPRLEAAQILVVAAGAGLEARESRARCSTRSPRSSRR